MFLSNSENKSSQRAWFRSVVCLVESLKKKKKKKKKKQWLTKHLLSVFNNSLLLRLFKLIATSLLTNSSPTQKQKTLHFPWFYVTVGVKIRDHFQYKLAGGSHVFSSQENESCTWSISADIYTGVSGYFHPNFHYMYWRDKSDEINLWISIKIFGFYFFYITLIIRFTKVYYWLSLAINLKKFSNFIQNLFLHKNTFFLTKKCS